MSTTITMRRASTASLVGSVLEWYDFFLYGTAAALVLGELFFPSDDPATATLLALLSFGGGFLTRPVGAVVFGHFGDRVGRKSMLVVTMLIMGVATFLIGLLPSYATWGVWAPIALVTLRLLQGVAIGGEWGGATLLTVENAPAGRRGFFGSLPQLGAPIGLLLSAGVFSLIERLPDAAMMAWGWRVPFLLSGVLLVAGLWVRARVGETEAFVQDRERSGEKRPPVPIVELLRTQWRQTLLAIGARLADAATFNVINVFAMAYAATTLGLDGSVMLTGFMISSALQIALIPVFGRLSDRVGRRPIYATGATICGLGVFGYFWALAQGSTPVVWAAIIVMHAFGTGMMFSIQSSFFSELFGTSVRYSGISIGYQASGLLAGAPTPAVAAALVAWAGGASWPVSIYLFLMCLVTMVCLMLAGETSRRSLTGSGDDPAEIAHVAEQVAMTPVVGTASASSGAHRGGVHG